MNDRGSRLRWTLFSCACLLVVSACGRNHDFEAARESEVERHYRDARILGIGGGTNEIMNEVISKRIGL